MNHGVENLNVNYLSPSDVVEPYHYFEAWLIGIASKLTFAKVGSQSNLLWFL